MRKVLPLKLPEASRTMIGPGYDLFPIYCCPSFTMSKPRQTTSKSVPIEGTIKLPNILGGVKEVYKQLQNKASPDQVHLLDTLGQMYTF